MKEFIKYSLQDYIRSHKYFPPISTFFILIVVNYTYKPNPVISSYAITALILYIISSWICVSFLSLDSPVQKQIMTLHIKSSNRYYISKLISVWLISIVLAVFAFLYPIIFNMFNEPVTIIVGLVSLVNHIALATLGISVASLFSKWIVDNPVNSYGGLAITVMTSIGAIGIYDLLPSTFKNIVWVIPPAVSTQTTLIHWSGKSILELSLFPFIWVFIYSVLILYLFLKLSKRLMR
ncbi:hypothetical protein NST86_29185 [Bacillus sp. FSL L8-0199]|uniref:Uncharacterized protein n=1 Tax=Bacillus cereus TaxID=1396 RepID=A0A9X0MH94_BACCE|nr:MULTISPECIES: hypothetical protein [Bacillus cereus group]KXY43355.1 hypothetical protein AT268_27685 [Bacillus cereus]MCU4825394.1 hypothetical protein [Bacillus cereus]MCU4858270.1 hypothetical protein [Bacillus cereus]MCU4875004.1 hypothetical protein [Bacillus cereus]MCU4943316.1 hypothetical protein [Bacillus cereus]